MKHLIVIISHLALGPTLRAAVVPVGHAAAHLDEAAGEALRLPATSCTAGYSPASCVYPYLGQSGTCWSGTGSAERRTDGELPPELRYQQYLYSRVISLTTRIILPPLPPLIPPGEDAEDADRDDDPGEEREPQPHGEEYPGLGLDHLNRASL